MSFLSPPSMMRLMIILLMGPTILIAEDTQHRRLWPWHGQGRPLRGAGGRTRLHRGPPHLLSHGRMAGPWRHLPRGHSLPHSGEPMFTGLEQRLLRTTQHQWLSHLNPLHRPYSRRLHTRGGRPLMGGNLGASFVRLHPQRLMILRMARWGWSIWHWSHRTHTRNNYGLL